MEILTNPHRFNKMVQTSGPLSATGDVTITHILCSFGETNLLNNTNVVGNLLITHPQLVFPFLPTSDANLPTGTLWNNNGVINCVPPLVINLWYATGRNVEEQLGIGDDYTQITSFIPITGNWDDVFVGGSRTFALSGDRYFATGYNEFGQLGLGTNDYSVGFFTPLTGKWDKVVLGLAQTYALSGKTLFATGRNQYGSLGNNTTQNSSSFIPVTGQWDDIFTNGGAEHAFALSGQRLHCVGRNTQGQLGLGFTTSFPFAVSNFTLLSGNWDRVVTSVSNTFAFSGKNVYVAGANDKGSLGIGNTTQVTTLIPLTGQWDDIVSGDDFTYAKSGSQWFGCGNGIHMGFGGTADRTSFVTLTGQWDRIICGDQHAFALSGNRWFVIGSVFFGLAGQTGLNGTFSVFMPLTGRWDDIKAAPLHTFALSTITVNL